MNQSLANDLPELRDILRVVREFIEHVTDSVPAKDRYHALCCSYLLSIAERELAQDGQIPPATHQLLHDFLGACDPAAATGLLSENLQAGRYDERLDEVLPLVLRLVIDKVRMTKPEHLAPLHQETR